MLAKPLADSRVGIVKRDQESNMKKPLMLSLFAGRLVLTKTSPAVVCLDVEGLRSGTAVIYKFIPGGVAGRNL